MGAYEEHGGPVRELILNFIFHFLKSLSSIPKEIRMLILNL